ncbi:unnamed protein product [Adineta ricciae]|uniref:small monomeric GTPase n=1 Tax=Adineta ricciae TaxID=249248 RepID=A0A815IVC1_ADIRI|nr:unnamed protein product [Adineta ricciae]CAF1370807.1 unnamed protein product [Adineta ricciae]
MSGHKFSHLLSTIGNDVDQLDKLQKNFQNEYDQTSKVVEKLEEEPQNQATTTELNRLQQLQKSHRIKIRLTGLKAEKAADDRDAVLSKECRLNNKRGTILILGLSNSGKKTLLNTLKENKFDQYSSSFSVGSQELLIGNMKFTCTNIDLQHDGRLSKQIPMNDAIIFLIDLTDPIRFSTAKEIIMFLLNEKEISSKPLVIVGTKKDLIANVDEADLIEALGIDMPYNTSKSFKFYLANMKDMASFACAFRFIATFLNDQ